MTLVISRIWNNKIYILGDTELTFSNGKNSNPFVNGCLKQYIITNSLAIAFAGVREHFEAVCSSLFECVDPNEMVRIAIESQSRGQNYELLIAEVGYERIRFIKDSQLHEAEAGYIGDLDAFKVFQEYYHTYSDIPLPELGKANLRILQLPEPSLKDEIYERLYTSFKQVILDERISGVGGVIVPLCTHKHKFQYMTYVDIVSDNLNIEEFLDEPKSINFGTTEGGGYSVKFSSNLSKEGKSIEVGYYFLQGGFGILFPKNKSDFRNAEIVKAKNPAYWGLKTRERIGTAISSGLLAAYHCCVAGESLLREDRFLDALFCYELHKDTTILNDQYSIRDRYFAGYGTALFNCGRTSEAIKILADEVNSNENFTSCQEMLNKMLCAI